GQQTAVGVRGRLDRARTYEHKRGAEGRQPGPARRCPEVPDARALFHEFGPKDAIHCAPIPPPGNRAARRDWFRGGARRQHCQWPEGLLMQFRALKGMNDLLPGEPARWQRLEAASRRTMELHGYGEVRTPVLEPLELFVRSTGETSEIVEKQMFELERGGERLALRPEGTPGAARAFIGANQHAREPVTRWYYIGPMFRAEQPQRGRYRQFHQAGCELYGDTGPVADAELIGMLIVFLSGLVPE